MSVKMCQYCRLFKPKDEVKLLQDKRRWQCTKCTNKTSPQQYRNKKNEEGDK